MKKLILIRHSKTIFQPEVCNLQWRLSPEGVQMAETLARDPIIKTLNVIYCSDQTKALHTTILLAKDNYIPIKVIPELTEATSITKKFFENYEETVTNWYNNPGTRINEGETTEEALRRFSTAVEDIIMKESADQIGIVAHANVLSLFASQFEERTALELHNTIPMPSYAILDWESKLFIKKFSND